MIKIIVELGGSKEITTPTGVEGAVASSISIKAAEGSQEIYPDQLCGALLIAYNEAVRKFIDTHPAECKGCVAYRFHSTNMYRAHHLLKEITGIHND